MPILTLRPSGNRDSERREDPLKAILAETETSAARTLATDSGHRATAAFGVTEQSPGTVGSNEEKVPQEITEITIEPEEHLSRMFLSIACRGRPFLVISRFFRGLLAEPSSSFSSSSSTSHARPSIRLSSHTGLSRNHYILVRPFERHRLWRAAANQVPSRLSTLPRGSGSVKDSRSVGTMPRLQTTSQPSQPRYRTGAHWFVPVTRRGRGFHAVNPSRASSPALITVITH